MKSFVNKFLGSSVLLEPITLGGAALVAGGTALANWLFNKEQNSSNVGKSKELMDYQIQKQQQYQRWLSAMQYPSMIASLRSAGLNPNLALGGTPSQMQASQPSATTGQQPTKLDVLGAASAISNLNLMNSQKELNLAQAEDLRESARNRREDTQYKSFLNDTFWDNYAFTMAETASRTSKNYTDIDVAYQTIKNLQAEYDNLVVTLDNLKKEGRLTEVNIENAQKVAKAEVAKLYSEVDFNKSENKRRDDLNRWTVEVENATVANRDMDTWMKREYMRLTREQVNIIQKYGADSQQAQIIATYVNAFANALNGGANMVNSVKNPFSGLTSTINNYDSNGNLTGSSVTTRNR